MNRIRQRSCSPYDWTNKILTDRSQHQINTHRNSNTQLLDTTAHKNVSQTIRKQERKSQQSKVMQRKKSVSSYYFQNIKRKHSTNDQNLVNTLNNKNAANNSQRNRCETSCNMTTNKIDKSVQQICTIYISQQSCQPCESRYFCINHPMKQAYFEQQSLQICYCHECSIQNVKRNKRLIQLTPEIKQVKRLISKKISQTQWYGQELCSRIHKTIEKIVQQFQLKYNQLKKQFAQQSSRHQQTHQQTMINIEMRQIDWSFIKQIGQNQMFKFLNPSLKKYRMIKKSCEQINKKIILEKHVQELEVSPIRKKEESIEKVFQQSQSNETEGRSKNLLKEIQKALNCQSKNAKLKVKKVNLLCFQQKRQSQSQNKQNINPNYQN